LLIFITCQSFFKSFPPLLVLRFAPLVFTGFINLRLPFFSYNFRLRLLITTQTGRFGGQIQPVANLVKVCFISCLPTSERLLPLFSLLELKIRMHLQLLPKISSSRYFNTDCLKCLFAGCGPSACRRGIAAFIISTSSCVVSMVFALLPYYELRYPSREFFFAVFKNNGCKFFL